MTDNKKFVDVKILMNMVLLRNLVFIGVGATRSKW